MSVLPRLVGFCLRIGPGEAHGSPTLTAAGTPVALQADVQGVVVEGTGIAPQGTDGWALLRDDDVALAMAGEIYQRDALAAAAGAGDGCQDVELLLACVRRYGVAAFRLANGRFAAVVVSAERIVLAADHAASVPLYVRVGEGQVWAATEAKALAGDAAPARPGRGGGALAGCEPVPGAPGLHRVRAGTVVALETARLPGRPPAAHALRTWTPPESRTTLPPARAVAAVAGTLDAAVRARLRGDAVTLVLSGGIDSGSLAALATAATPAVRTVTLGTDAGDEFETARAVVAHLGTTHTELAVPADDLVGELPFAVAAAEIADPDVLEYLLPLVALYRRLPGPPRRVLTGYGADIPLGGMHRAVASLAQLDEAIADDMATFDGLNELSPLVSGVAGHWSTHPYWDRDVLELLTSLEPGLKRRDGEDKWVLRAAMADRLPPAVRQRPKLGIHEGSGLTSRWSRLLRDAGVAGEDVPAVKRDIARRIYDDVVLRGVPAGEVDVWPLMAGVAV